MTNLQSVLDYQEILEKYGGKIADKSRSILLNDPALKEVNASLEFIYENWRDLTPGLMELSCQAVGGKPRATEEVALSYSLINLSFTTFDDVIDEARYKSFKPTLFGKNGKDIAIIIGGIAAAKAFSILNENKLDEPKRRKINRLFWKLWTTMASVEAKTLTARKNKEQTSKLKLWKINSEVSDLGYCLKIGSIIGGGSDDQCTYLEKYGRCLGSSVAIKQDFEVSLNLTLELFEKIRTNKCPYGTLWAMEHSVQFKELCGKVETGTADIDLEFTKLFMEQYLASGIIDHCQKLFNTYKRGAIKALDHLEANSAVDSLRAIVRSVPFFQDIDILDL